jgi:ribonuclease HI
MADRKIDKIYTDGACSGNPGPGGWGTVIYYDDGSVHELGGGERQTTNNRMEMQAAIAGLQFLEQSGQQTPIALYTDSEYVKNGITKWIQGWKNKGWKTSTGKPVLNQDLWETLDELNSKQVEWRYVRGHTGDIGNERCDTIARAYAQGQTPALKQGKISKSTASPVPQPAQMTGPAAAIVVPELPLPLSNDASTMTDTAFPLDSSDDLPREIKVVHLRNTVETLHMADEIATRAYLITSSELADLMDVNASAVTSRGDNWVWRNWVVSRVRREGNQILWQLERVD